MRKLRLRLTLGNPGLVMTNLASVTRLRLRASTTAHAASEGFWFEMPGKHFASKALAKEAGARARWAPAARSTACISCGMRMGDENCAKAVMPTVGAGRGGAG